MLAKLGNMCRARMMRSSGVQRAVPRNYPEPFRTYVVQLTEKPWRSSECSVSSSAPPAYPPKMNQPILKRGSCTFLTMSQNPSAKASCKVRYAIEMQTSLVNSFCTENGSQFNFAPHPQSAKPRSVTCIFPNPTRCSAALRLPICRLVPWCDRHHRVSPPVTVYCIASGNRTFRYHCADALEEGISPVSNENQYRQHARECFELANEMNDPGNKALLVAMAQSWSNLADQAAKNAETDVIHETATRPQK